MGVSRMTENEMLKIKEHIEIHARREHRAITITEILWKAVDELEHIAVLEKENERLAKRICELQSDLSRVKSLNEKMKRCCNCVHRFVVLREGTCQRPNCKNYSEWCFDGKRP